MIHASVLYRIAKMDSVEEYDEIGDCVSVLMAAALEGDFKADLILEEKRARGILPLLQEYGFKLVDKRPAQNTLKTWYTIGWD